MSETEVVHEGSAETHADWPKVLEWVEKQCQDSMKERYATAEILTKEAQVTLTVLLAGVGAAAAYGIKLFDATPAGPVVIASAVVCVYLVAVSMLLVVKCMMYQAYPAMYQEPENLMQREWGLSALREVELENVSKRIGDAKAINDHRASWLNGLRIAAILATVVFGATALTASVYGPRVAIAASQSAWKLKCAVAPGTIPPSPPVSASAAVTQQTTDINCQISN